jgi:hypothetical protein
MLSKLFGMGGSRFGAAKRRTLPGWSSLRKTRNTGKRAEHEGSTTLPEALPHASPDQLPHDWHLELRCPHWLEQGHLNWEWPN